MKVGVGETELERDGSVRNAYGEMDASHPTALMSLPKKYLI